MVKMMVAIERQNLLQIAEDKNFLNSDADLDSFIDGLETALIISMLVEDDTNEFIPLSELTSEMVGEFLEERRRFGNHRPGNSGLGEETMRHIHRLLQQCLDQAIRDGLLTENPAKAFRYRKSTTVKANIMTPLEMEDYLDAAERLGYLPMFMLALTTGLRQGELIALKWSDLA